MLQAKIGPIGEEAVDASLGEDFECLGVVNGVSMDEQSSGMDHLDGPRRDQVLVIRSDALGSVSSGEVDPLDVGLLRIVRKVPLSKPEKENRRRVGQMQAQKLEAFAFEGLEDYTSSASRSLLGPC